MISKFLSKALFIFLIGFLFSFIAFPSKAQYSPTQIKIALIVHFIEHTTFPSEAFKSPKEMIQIGILGDDPFGDELESFLMHYKINGRGLRVRRKKNASDLWGCQVIYISKSEQNKLTDILDYFRRYPTLTIGDNLKGFIEQCGIINFVTVGDKPYRFELNIEAAQKSNLGLDVGLFRMAKRIVACP
ncbi:YfiR family protein [Bernardetia litoralis]|uniref:YfiR family protein n=1 Tax=Bernardetia litoralis TaxID=999 RepID=UPI00031D04D9|nr:YfiR family protein [Bernardetia litoralis]